MENGESCRWQKQSDNSFGHADQTMHNNTEQQNFFITFISGAVRAESAIIIRFFVLHSTPVEFTKALNFSLHLRPQFSEHKGKTFSWSTAIAKPIQLKCCVAGNRLAGEHKFVFIILASYFLCLSTRTRKQEERYCGQAEQLSQATNQCLQISVLWRAMERGKVLRIFAPFDDLFRHITEGFKG